MKSISLKVMFCYVFLNRNKLLYDFDTENKAFLRNLFAKNFCSTACYFSTQYIFYNFDFKNEAF